MHRRFGPQVAQQRVAFLGQFSQSLSLSAGMLTRNHPDVAGDLVGGGKTTRVSKKHLGRQSRHCTCPGMGEEPARLWLLSSQGFHYLVQFLYSFLQL